MGEKGKDDKKEISKEQSDVYPPFLDLQDWGHAQQCQKQQGNSEGQGWKRKIKVSLERKEKAKEDEKSKWDLGWWSVKWSQLKNKKKKRKEKEEELQIWVKEKKGLWFSPVSKYVHLWISRGEKELRRL